MPRTVWGRPHRIDPPNTPPKRNPQYSQEVKDTAVQLHTDGSTVSAIRVQLFRLYERDVSEQAVRNWIRRANEDEL